MSQTIQETIRRLHGSLSDYIEATYHISAPSLIRQRKDLLAQDGVIHRVPYIESTPRYKAGIKFAEMKGLPAAALEVYTRLSKAEGQHGRLLYDPPYKHQSEAICEALINKKNLVIMTGTGSGKTESFLLPILGKLACEAKSQPQAFKERSAVRALVLYPMNALVNDQLGRLRSLFGDPRLVEMFMAWCGRPARFARYTSRTPYAGVRTTKKDYTKYKSFEQFYVDLERQAATGEPEDRESAMRLLKALKDRGKWPSKPNLSTWFGEKKAHWQDKKTGKSLRAVTLEEDAELITRHEVQAFPPDLLVTNYSMLEYMLMRPIERTIFDRTSEWLKANKNESFMVVLDEAHLYRGAPGAEVGLLLRRLRSRLGIPPERFQVICATASFTDKTYAPSFGSQLSGVAENTFIPITGDYDLREPDTVGSSDDAAALALVSLDEFYKAASDEERLTAVSSFLRYRKIEAIGSYEVALYRALESFGPMGKLINATMKQARPVAELSAMLFPDAAASTADAAVTVLLALGSIARLDAKATGLLPCRIHNFFRGLPGLWACMNPDCSQISEDLKEGICGKLYGQPRERCGCGARVLEFYTCRHCGTGYARAYTDDVEGPSALWSEEGQRLRMAGGEAGPLLPLDLLLENPADLSVAEPWDYDLETGRLNPNILGPRTRKVHLRCDRTLTPTEEDAETARRPENRGQFIPCAVCGEKPYGRTPVQDHQTKGDEPFTALVIRQIQIQPPGPAKADRFAPLQGRKVLTFSDSRQVAARLAPNLQMYSVRDSLRPLIAWGYTRLQKVPALQTHLSLEALYLAVLLASKELKVRLRPELKGGENFNAELVVERAVNAGAINSDADLLNLYFQVHSEKPPEALLENIVTTIQHRFLGLEALALASVVETGQHTAALEKLPSIPGIAETPESKIGLARAWLRCWRKYGFRLNHMPLGWLNRPAADGVNVRKNKGKFTKDMQVIIPDKAAYKIFDSKWVPALNEIFTEESEDSGLRRLRGSQVSLKFDGLWVHCRSCKSAHRPIPGITYCLDCGSSDVNELNPEADEVFGARKGYYRQPVIEALGPKPRQPMALIAAEHTAQLNAPQNDDVFSQAESNELLFQDIRLSSVTGRASETAIDVLSSTTTMEVGIDLGALTGVALRNMPPGRANYQQRAGRAGRRGNAVATVVAFGSADSHDEHYFSSPDGMIRGDVVDPKLTLDNKEIARRHLRAFLLQNYHQEMLPEINPSERHDLFSVLGTVAAFRKPDSVLSRDGFANWLSKNEAELKGRVIEWIPKELSATDRQSLLDEMLVDTLGAIDDAIRPVEGEKEGASPDEAAEEEMEAQEEEGEERPRQLSTPSKLLDRLLYCGKLPRYAFPTDVATFHVFDKDRSTRFRPIMKFAPSQGLPIALSQYAPGKQVWIAGKCYTSGAVYSVMSDDRFNAWENKRIYLECSECGYAKTIPLNKATKGATEDCVACGGDNTFGPARFWLRPPGFAHPEFMEEVTSPDDMPDTSYATRAKLTMGTPAEEAGWVMVNDRIRGLSSRQHLLVSNTGPDREGYSYCTKCGRIEASTDSSPQLGAAHRKPFPEEDPNKKMCEGGGTSRHVVLGTDFITDIALFSMRIAAPLSLRPGHSPTAVALRTVSEALAKAACQMLEIEPGELMAEFRPALTPAGTSGLESEIFLYDTLPGGAGFASQLPGRGQELFQRALKLMQSCPENCDASCYRCLRSFKNKFEHGLLDRHVGTELLKYILHDEAPSFNNERLRTSSQLLAHDLERQGVEGVTFACDVPISVGSVSAVAPIVATRPDGRKTVIALSGALSDGHPADGEIAAVRDAGSDVLVIVENELVVRRNLPAATRNVMQAIIER